MEPIRTFTQSRRNLPHWELPGEVYFLTWRVISDRMMEAEDRTIAMNAVRYWDRKKWAVFSSVIMPDHVHVLARPLPVRSDETELETFRLSEILHSVKGYSSKEINRRQRREGTFWQDEWFDRIVRDDREFDDTCQYICNNPVEAGLVKAPEEWQWLYETDSIG